MIRVSPRLRIFGGRAVRVTPRISRILADMRPQEDASAIADTARCPGRPVWHFKGHRERPMWHRIEAVAAVYLGYFKRQMTVVEIIIAELHCLSNGGTVLTVQRRMCAMVGGALSETVATVSLRTKRMLSMFRLQNKKCSETGPNRRCSGPEQYQKLFRFDL